MNHKLSPVPLTGEEKKAAEQIIAQHFEEKILAAEEIVAKAESELRAAQAAAGAWSDSRSLTFLQAFDIVGSASQTAINAGQDILLGNGARDVYDRLKAGCDLVSRYVADVLGHDLKGDRSDSPCRPGGDL
ncbi:hypothetical protein [Nonomuraea sp. NPDC052265]|uniref:hypothetical protein n=1 Tax=Nonomuraea sp. NPDC052265 TaxID=3364374 RepID=UPI0037C54113